MKRRNRIISFFAFFTIISFWGIVGINVSPETNTYEFAELTRLGKLIGESEASGAEIDEQAIDAILNAKVKYIEFSDSKKFDPERKIVCKVTNMAESEKYSGGSMKKAIIRIALKDLNDDGVKEILAYIIQFEYCGRGGGYCTLLVLQRNKNGKWQRIFITAAYEGDIGILNTKHYGYYDIAIRLSHLREGEVIAIPRWNMKLYEFMTKRQIIYDSETNREKVKIWNWNKNTSDFEVIREFNRLKPGHNFK